MSEWVFGRSPRFRLFGTALRLQQWRTRDDTRSLDIGLRTNLVGRGARTTRGTVSHSIAELPLTVLLLLTSSIPTLVIGEGMRLPRQGHSLNIDINKSYSAPCPETLSKVVLHVEIITTDAADYDRGGRNCVMVVCGWLKCICVFGLSASEV